MGVRLWFEPTGKIASVASETRNARPALGCLLKRLFGRRPRSLPMRRCWQDDLKPRHRSAFAVLGLALKTENSMISILQSIGLRGVLRRPINVRSRGNGPRRIWQLRGRLSSQNLVAQYFAYLGLRTVAPLLLRPWHRSLSNCEVVVGSLTSRKSETGTTRSWKSPRPNVRILMQNPPIRDNASAFRSGTTLFFRACLWCWQNRAASAI